jgi:hypothetical protein
LVSAASVHSRPAAREWIWWEAETPRSGNFPASNPFVSTAALSGGTWIGADAARGAAKEPLFLEYDVAVRTGGSYDFYARKFWHHGPFRWRFDGQPWRRCERETALLDDVKLTKTVEVTWVGLGAVKLTAGRHVLRIEVDRDAPAVAFDCFLLIDGPFTPRGKLKPGESYGVTPAAGWFAFEPGEDSFEPSPLDLRWLNEKTAGEGGFIQTKGDAFVHGDTGQPIRFWGVNVEQDVLRQDGAALDRFARRLAKYGVNMVRVYGPLWREDDLTRVDEARLDAIHRFVAALKREGIYLSLCSYYPLWFHPESQPGFEGLDGKKNPFAILFFNPRTQQMQRDWWRAVLTAKNPYTGSTLLADPTLAFIELQNEDSLLFWTFAPYETVPAPQMEILERAFGSWLVTKYGSLDGALGGWPGHGLLGRLTHAAVRGDDPAAGRVGLMPLGQLTGRNARARDTAAFLADVQRSYFDRMYAYLKRELGFRGSVTGSNWITADPQVLGPLDKWSNAGCDFMDRHGYYGGPHQGESASYLVSNGDRYNDASALRFETGKPGETSFNLPLMDLAYDGKPSTISEVNWDPPNRFRAEMPALAAGYGALQGSDAILFFESEGTGWVQPLAKFTISDPVGVGQFPATALAFRTGLVRTGEVARHIEAKLSSVKALEGAGLDSIDPLAYLTGRVEVAITDHGGPSRGLDLSTFVDRRAKTVRSTTGELAWDWGRGLVTIDAPSVQGVTGFLGKAGPIKLGNVTIRSSLEYGAILLVAMDGRPLTGSRKMLLQVMSEDSNFGWFAPGQGLREIRDIGSAPVVVKRLDGTLTLDRSVAAGLKVEPLDANGYPSAARLSMSAEKQLTLLPTTFYYLLEK